jgi:hypothetical protein
MFGVLYFGQVPFASAPAPVMMVGGGGGWSHRAPVTLPKRRPTGLPDLPQLPKPPYVFYTDEHGPS